ncbi:MAG: CBS domain-containing protein, partial [Corynebacterium sp.]
ATADTISFLKSRHLVADTPVILGPGDLMAHAQVLIPKRAHGYAVVVDDDGQPLGLVARAEPGPDLDMFGDLRTAMQPIPVLLPDTTDPRTVFETLTEANVELAVLVDDAGALTGVLSRVGALRAGIYQPNVDADGHLRVATAVGINGDVVGKARALVEAGSDL